MSLTTTAVPAAASMPVLKVGDQVEVLVYDHINDQELWLPAVVEHQCSTRTPSHATCQRPWCKGSYASMLTCLGEESYGITWRIPGSIFAAKPVFCADEIAPFAASIRTIIDSDPTLLDQNVEPNPESLKQILCLVTEAEAAVKISHPDLTPPLGWFGHVVLRAAVEIEPKFPTWTRGMEVRFCLEVTLWESLKVVHGNPDVSWQDIFEHRYCSAA